jgi:hypothetical protein
MEREEEKHAEGGVGEKREEGSHE